MLCEKQMGDTAAREGTGCIGSLGSQVLCNIMTVFSSYTLGLRKSSAVDFKILFLCT